MNQNLEEVSCNYCNSKFFKIKYVVDGFNYVQCNVCGFVFVNPRLPADAIKSLYNEDYFGGKGFDKSVEYKKEFEKQSNSIDLNDWDISTIKSFLPKSDAELKLLDVGCGMGLFAYKAKQKGFIAEGLELSEFGSKFAASKGIKVQRASIEQAEMQPNFYNVISMKEVIEHLPDPTYSLKKIYDSLQNNGLLFLTTGNYNCPERKIRGNKWFYFMPQGHLQVFSHTTIRKFLIKAGFRKIIVTRQGDLLMNFLLKHGIIDINYFKPKNFLKRILFESVRFVNQFISSGMRIYAIK
jgi:2-polyprenyl-3-methyl-5-hydroxy-6-metoxy-1,4-benzoquinol methylase